MNAISRVLQRNYNSSSGVRETNHCPKCNDRGYFMNIDKVNGVEYEVLVKCNCMGEYENSLRLRNSGLESMRNFRFDNFNTENPWQDSIKNLAMENSKAEEWFFIGGQVGSGKTHISLAICNEIMKEGRQVRYSIWTDDIRSLKSATMDQNFREKMNRFKTVDVLYIDDLFKSREKPTQSDVEITFEIINYRYLNNLKTIISSEKSMSEILYIDEALGSRVKEKCKKFALNIGKGREKNQRLKS